MLRNTNAEMVLPMNAVKMTEDEMMYVEGGAANGKRKTKSTGKVVAPKMTSAQKKQYYRDATMVVTGTLKYTAGVGSLIASGPVAGVCGGIALACEGIRELIRS